MGSILDRFSERMSKSGQIPSDDEWKDKIPGGKADKKVPSDFLKENLQKGIGVEKEHTSNPEIATEISMDHLTESDEYYDKLADMEKTLEKDKKEGIDTSTLNHLAPEDQKEILKSKRTASLSKEMFS